MIFICGHCLYFIYFVYVSFSPLLNTVCVCAGRLLVFDIREDSCNGVPSCNNVLQVTEIIVVSIYFLVVLVLGYFAIIFMLVALFFFAYTIHYYCSGNSSKDKIEEMPVKEQEV